MLRKFYTTGLVLMVVAGLVAQPAFAETPSQVLAAIQSEAAKVTPGFQGFSAARGESFFKTTHGNELSCASCHNPHGSNFEGMFRARMDTVCYSCHTDAETNFIKASVSFYC